MNEPMNYVRRILTIARTALSRWSITPEGKRWLKAHPAPKARSRSVSTTSEAVANE